MTVDVQMLECAGDREKLGDGTDAVRLHARVGRPPVDGDAKRERTSLHRRIPYPDEKDDRKEEPRTVTERLEERYATEIFERPRRGGKTSAVAVKPSPDTTATNIIHMPAPPPDDKTATRP